MERKASKHMAVVRVCVSTFVRVTTLDILKETSGENPDVLVSPTEFVVMFSVALTRAKTQNRDKH